QMLAGQPLQQRGELTTADPFPGVTDSGSVESTIAGAKNASFYRIASGDQWFFDDLNRSYLTRRSTNGNDTVLADAAWLAPHHGQIWCSGQLSITEPHRFLAVAAVTSASL